MRCWLRVRDGLTKVSTPATKCRPTVATPNKIKPGFTTRMVTSGKSLSYSKTICQSWWALAQLHAARPNLLVSHGEGRSGSPVNESQQLKLRPSRGQPCQKNDADGPHKKGPDWKLRTFRRS